MLFPLGTYRTLHETSSFIFFAAKASANDNASKNPDTHFVMVALYSATSSSVKGRTSVL